MIKAILATLALAVLPIGLHAQGNIFGPNSIRIIEINIFDDSDGGCWTNISEVKTYLEDQLRLSGYELTGVLSNNQLHSEEETARIMDLVYRLQLILGESVVHAIRNHVYIDNFYSVHVVANVTRHIPPYHCWGDIEMQLMRQVTTHDGSIYTAPFRTLRKAFVGQHNVNMQVFDLIKAFITDIREYK